MVYVLMADGFEEIEALMTVDLLRRGGAKVAMVGVTNKAVMGSHQIPVLCDMSVDEARASMKENDDLQMVVLPGGMPGAKNLDQSVFVDEVLNMAVDKGAYIAAICASPMVLGKRGLLVNKKATCYPGYEKDLIGCYATNGSVIVDGKIITGRGMGYSMQFAVTLLKMICGTNKADEVQRSVLA